MRAMGDLMAGGVRITIDGDRFDLNWVDWDNDRHQDGWLSYMKEWMDNVYRRHRFWTQLDMPEPPSHYFDRQVYGTFQEDKAGVAARHFIGVDNIMWASDYPHSDTTWPESVVTVHRAVSSSYSALVT